MESLFEILHVTTAIFLIGPMAVLPMAGLRALRAGSASQVKTIATATALCGWLSLIVALLGFGLVSMADPKHDLSYTTPWLLASIVLYSIAVTITLSGVAPMMTRAADRLADGTPATGVVPVAVLTVGSALLLVAVTVLMVWRP